MSAALCARQAPFALRTAFTPALPARGAAAPLRRAMPPRRLPAPAAAAASGSTPAVPAVPAAGGDGVQGDMLHPSTANNPAVRLLAITAVVAAAARSTGFLPATGLAFVHVLAYGTWLGTLAWTSFVFGIVAFRNLPRQTFGRLQSKLFPKYFILSAACAAILLATLHFGAGAAAPAKQLWLLGIGLAGSLGNLLWAEPAATALMFQRYELENAPGARDDAAIKALYKQFGKYHGISSLLNLAVLVCVVGHGYYLGAHLTLGA